MYSIQQGLKLMSVNMPLASLHHGYSRTNCYINSADQVPSIYLLFGGTNVQVRPLHVHVPLSVGELSVFFPGFFGLPKLHI